MAWVDLFLDCVSRFSFRKYTMNIKKTLLSLGASALFLTATQAYADGEWYASLKGGANFPDQGLDTGWQIDGGLGYRFILDGYKAHEGNETAIRLEFNPGFMRNSPKGGVNDVDVGRFMGNVYLDLPILDWAYIYGGAGMGGALYDVENVDSDFVFAYQGMAGIGFLLSDNIKLEGGYRYFSSLDPTFLNTQVTAPNYHSVEAGIRFEF